MKGIKFCELHPKYYWKMMDVVSVQLSSYQAVRHTLQDYRDAKSTYNAGDEL